MVHTLITSFQSTVKAIIRCFVKLKILNGSNPLELPLELQNYKDVKDVLYGPNTEAYLNEEGASGKAVEQFRLTCLGLKHMRKRKRKRGIEGLERR
ncbi:hypothetical protein QYM36_020119 [Artemia franciscana]|uniref:Uncharacterized protein n=1 Tax=Artemia franciscana TaxID=6661 RepID=A0AA88H993_ARTSF|nr:hypothetical protein QYM36_020119 [Artemia franciscana]